MSTSLYQRVAGHLGLRRVDDGPRVRGAREIDLSVSRRRNHHEGRLPESGTSLSRIRLH